VLSKESVLLQTHFIMTPFHFSEEEIIYTGIGVKDEFGVSFPLPVRIEEKHIYCKRGGKQHVHEN
jgi:hypothetical protein